jgi:acetolactate decarboxylase
MGQLNTHLSTGLWRALHRRAETTREPVAHIDSRALAECLQLSHHTLFQVSTSGALVDQLPLTNLAFAADSG